MKRAKSAEKTSEISGTVGLEAKLWAAADALRNNMDAAEYKHVVLGLIFLKYISDAFEAKHAELEAQKAQGADPEDRDEYRAASIFWVPKEARWQHLKASAPQPTIGTLVDDAMAAIERDNSSLKGVLPKDYARPGLDKQRLGQIINLVSDIALGSAADRAKDTLGRVYEYFLSRFASAEGKSGGQFYTPSHVVRVLVEVLQTRVSPEGTDKGIDILAAPGSLGFGHPRICVQVKSGTEQVDRPTLDQLLGAM
jgi:type I restriction enzyme M protein